MFDDTLITGITEIERYPACITAKYCKQCLQTDVLYIPEQKPDIESINEIKLKVTVDCFEVFNTILGPKIFINGIKEVKIMYTANNCLQSVHSAHWCVPFCEYILLGDLHYEKINGAVKNVFAGVEKVCIKYFDKRLVDMDTLFVLCPEIDRTYNETCKKVDDCYKNYYNNNKPMPYGRSKNNSFYRK